MADHDFEAPSTPNYASNGNSGAGGRNSGRKIGSKSALEELRREIKSGKDAGSYEERLQNLKRLVKETHDHQKREEDRARRKEQEMAKVWLEQRASKRERVAEETRTRLDALKRQRERAENKARRLLELEAEKLRVQRTQKLEAAQDQEESSESEMEEHNTEAKIGDDPYDGLSLQLSLAKARISIKPRKSLAKGRKKGEATLGNAGVVGKQPQAKSIMQEAQEKFQGLCRSSDGREILQLGSKQQKQYRDALLRGDPLLVERAEREVANQDEVAEAETPDPQSSTAERLLMRRHHLRSMNLIASEVLESKKRMKARMLPPLSARGLLISSESQAPSFQ